MSKKNYVEVKGMRIGEGIPKICVPIVERSTEEILAAAVALLKEPVDLVEWRADFFNDIEDLDSVDEVLRLLHKVLGNIPVLFTFRTMREGGERECSTLAYIELIEHVAASGLADLIDVELSMGEAAVANLVDAVHSCEGIVIASSHNFDSTPARDEMITTMRRMQALDADILKIAVMPNNKQDVLLLLSATEEMTRVYADRPVITIAMGADGQISRVACEAFGSSVTFGAVGKQSAPGQMNVKNLSEILQRLHTRKKENVFLIGFMGTGKSTIGKVLSRKIGAELIEMDAVIEDEQEMPIPKIFEQFGESYFRDLETAYLQRLPESGPKVVSCGGGVPMRADNVRLMKEQGVIVLLTAKPETVLARVGTGTDRPLLQNRMHVEGISELMEERLPVYEAAADVTIETDNRTVAELAGEIAELTRGMLDR